MEKIAGMSPDEFKQALRTLGVTQEEFGVLVGAKLRTVVYWAGVAVPGPVATLVTILLRRPELLDVVRDFSKERRG